MNEKERYKYCDLRAIAAVEERLDNGEATICGADTTDLTLGDGQSVDLAISCDADRRAAVELNVSVASGAVAELHLNYQEAGFLRANINVALGKNARLEYTELTTTGGYLRPEISFTLEQNAHISTRFLDVDNQYVIRNISYNLAAPGAEVVADGAYLCGQGEVVDNYLIMNHLAHHTVSRQKFRGVVKHAAAFMGHIKIHPQANGCEAYQENNNVVLEPKAKAYSRPWLEIYNDDVKCSHGSTMGKNNPLALFYMRQRGIPDAKAKMLLLKGFITELCGENEEWEERVEQKLYKISD